MDFSGPDNNSFNAGSVYGKYRDALKLFRMEMKSEIHELTTDELYKILTQPYFDEETAGFIHGLVIDELHGRTVDANAINYGDFEAMFKCLKLLISHECMEISRFDVDFYTQCMFAMTRFICWSLYRGEYSHSGDIYLDMVDLCPSLKDVVYKITEMELRHDYEHVKHFDSIETNLAISLYTSLPKPSTLKSSEYCDKVSGMSYKDAINAFHDEFMKLSSVTRGGICCSEYSDKDSMYPEICEELLEKSFHEGEEYDVEPDDDGEVVYEDDECDMDDE
jgi:hypothetical protein